MNNQKNRDSFDIVSNTFENSENRDFAILEFNHDNKVSRHPHMNDGFIAVVCMKGSWKMKINFKEHNVQRNNLIFCTPYTMIEIVEASDDVEVHGIFFSFDLISGMLSMRNHGSILALIRNPCIEIDDELRDDFEGYFNFIKEQYINTSKEYSKDVIAALTLALYLKLHSVYRLLNYKSSKESSISSRNEEILESLIKLIMQHYQEERNISFYADKMCLTPKYLSSVVKKTTGNSLLFWINEALVADAKLRLKTTNLTVKQISDELNFSTPSLFGRFFKQRTGITPLQYRNRD